VPPATPAAVLAECHAAGSSGIFIISEHALDRAQERKIGRLDVRNALTGATAAELQDNGRWSVTGGADLEGVPVELIVAFDRGFVIVTVY
jgi:hypothetical protein